MEHWLVASCAAFAVSSALVLWGYVGTLKEEAAELRLRLSLHQSHLKGELESRDREICVLMARAGASKDELRKLENSRDTWKGLARVWERKADERMGRIDGLTAKAEAWDSLSEAYRIASEKEGGESERQEAGEEAATEAR